MTLFLDTADVSEWEALLPTGVFVGITTNPLLVSRAGLENAELDWRVLAQRAADLGAREFHAQVVGPPEEYIDWAGRFFEIGDAIGLKTVVKIPLVEPAIRTVARLKTLGGPILLTAAYEAKQMFVATALGADYIAPYFGRMIEAGRPAYDILDQMRAIGQASGSTTRILVASLRDTDQMCQLAARGQTAFTIAPDIARDLLNSDDTADAYAAFEASVAAGR